MLPKISMQNGHAANGPTDDDLAEIKSAVLAKLVLVRVDGFRQREVMECPRVPGSVRLDVRRPDHLGPLLGFVDDEFAKVGWRADKRR